MNDEDSNGFLLEMFLRADSVVTSILVDVNENLYKITVEVDTSDALLGKLAYCKRKYES